MTNRKKFELEIDDEQMLSADVGGLLAQLEGVSNAANECDAVASVHAFVGAFLDALLRDEKCETSTNIVKLAKRVFHYADLNLLVLQRFATKMRGLVEVGDNAKLKLAHFFVSLPILNKSRILLLSESQLKFGKINLDWARHCIYIQKAWLELLHLEFCPKLVRLLFPHFIESVMDHLPNCELFTDVLYHTFRLGGFMSVISLGGIFKLVVKRNLEHPNFYSEVYQIIHSNICYSNYAQKFFDLVDLIMSSSHIPTYVVCAFTKKLCRLLLFAPVHCQLPLIQLIKNLFCRHPTIHSVLIDRPHPISLEMDPYDERELDLQKCGATDSSLWELKALKWHWHDKVSTKANFVNSNVQDKEASLGWQTVDELFDTLFERANKILATPNGRKGAGSEEAQQNGDEETEETDGDGDEEENCGYWPDSIGGHFEESGENERKRKHSPTQQQGKMKKQRTVDEDTLFSFDQSSVWTF